MADQALYRKYRSTTLDEVVGQDQVVTTLKGALASGQISHAYLFTGQRGVGKTSVARILARSLNCTGEGTKPCNQCPNCTAALNGNLDIIEIDAASNRGIDEIRDLKEKIVLAPSLGKYKVYIIDEVHMLTDPAFNALLKTLEEPPAHAVFILATTEAHKLPLTIISRTQRFSFHHIPAPVIASHLKSVAAKEQIALDDEAASMIAAASGGSFRDGLSLLDQLSAGGETITASLAQQLLGWGSQAEVEALHRMIIEDDLSGALAQLDQLVERGAQPSQLIRQLISLVRADLRQRLEARNPTGPQLRLLSDLTATTKSALPQYALEIAIARYRQSAPAAATVQTPVKARPEAAVSRPEPVAAQPPPTPAPPARLSPQPAEPASQPATKTSKDESFDIRWMKALAEIKAHNNSLYALLCSCDAVQTSGGIELVTRFNFHRDRLMEPKNLAIIAAAAKKALGQEQVITSRVQQAGAPAASTDTELVSSALEILGGEVME